MDLEYRITGQSVEVVERRPAWRRPGETTETPVAKLTYVRSRDAWKIFWMRRDLRWHGWPPAPQVESLATALRIVDRDEYGCFWG